MFQMQATLEHHHFSSIFLQVSFIIIRHLYYFVKDFFFFNYIFLNLSVDTYQEYVCQLYA